MFGRLQTTSYPFTRTTTNFVVCWCARGDMMVWSDCVRVFLEGRGSRSRCVRMVRRLPRCRGEGCSTVTQQAPSVMYGTTAQAFRRPTPQSNRSHLQNSSVSGKCKTKSPQQKHFFYEHKKSQLQPTWVEKHMSPFVPEGKPPSAGCSQHFMTRALRRYLCSPSQNHRFFFDIFCFAPRQLWELFLGHANNVQCFG